MLNYSLCIFMQRGVKAKFFLCYTSNSIQLYHKWQLLFFSNISEFFFSVIFSILLGCKSCLAAQAITEQLRKQHCIILIKGKECHLLNYYHCSCEGSWFCVKELLTFYSEIVFNWEKLFLYLDNYLWYNNWFEKLKPLSHRGLQNSNVILTYFSFDTQKYFLIFSR